MSTEEIILDLRRRIDELESREAITDLIHRYTEIIRNGVPSMVADLMVDDAVVELRHRDPDDAAKTELVARYSGVEEIRGSFAAEAGGRARVWPMIHNLRIRAEGDFAEATCVLASAVWPVGKQFIGEYRDTFRRVGGEWRFASRTHTGFGDSTGQYARDAHASYQASKKGTSAESR